MNAKTLCIIVPVYNEAEGLSDLLDRLHSAARQYRQPIYAQYRGLSLLTMAAVTAVSRC